MLDDLNDVEDLTADVEVCIMHIPMRWRKGRYPHLTCLNCTQRIAALNNRKQSSCCGGSDSTNFYSTNIEQWKQHLRIHEAMGEEVPKEAWDLEL